MIDWQRMWNDDPAFRRFSPTRAALYLLSLLYRMVMDLRNRFYDRRILTSVRLSCPVISVGNLTVGGTGKTPCVIALALMLQKHGYFPAVISRGYGGRGAAPVNIVSDGKTIFLDAGTAGDEPLLIARSLPGIPVITGPERKLTGQAATDRFQSDVILCDDAFQHRRIFRDIDIVLLDAQRPLGNRRLLPAGELREPVSQLRRASCLILTRADQTTDLDADIARMVQDARIPVFRASHAFRNLVKFPDNAARTTTDLQGRKICAFCGIAKPESFKKMLADAGADIISFVDFPDHYDYNRSDLDALERHFQAFNADYTITTEKDAMRLVAWPDFLKTVWIARIEMDMAPSSPSFEEFILERLAKSKKG